MFNVNVIILAGVVCFSNVDCIVSKTGSTVDKNDIKNTDNAVSQTIDRDYIAGFEDNYGHGSYGLSAHANYGFPENHDGFGVVEGSKHHIHHTEDHHHHHHDHHEHYDIARKKALAIKTLLVPLAGIALLGAATAFVSNPILLQLGIISGSSLGRRKRDATGNSTPIRATMFQDYQMRVNDIKLLENFMSQVPKQDVKMQEKKILADYLSCSGLTIQNLCLERLTCELHSAEGTSMTMEANVLTIVVNEILDNNFIPDDTKIRLSKAIERGKKNFGCGIYECKELEKADEIPKTN